MRERRTKKKIDEVLSKMVTFRNPWIDAPTTVAEWTLDWLESADEVERTPRKRKKGV